MGLARFLIAMLLFAASLFAPTESRGQGEGDPVFRATLTLPFGSAIKQIDFRVFSAEGTGAAASVSSRLTEVVGEIPVRSVTVVLPDAESGKTDAEFRSGAEKITQALKAPHSQTARLSRGEFGDWFQQNRLRITIVAAQVTLMSGLKFAEIVYSSQPVEYAPALMAALSMGAVLGWVEWNSPRLFDFIMKPGALMKNLFDRLTEGARASARNEKIRKTMETAWSFTKNVGVNVALFGIFKIILYSATTSEAAGAGAVVEAMRAVTAPEVAHWAKLAVGATIVSFPTSKLIHHWRVGANEAAGDDAERLRWVRDRMLIYSSSALTARALLFSSILLAELMHWPTLSVAAYSGIALMFGGSVYKLWSDARNKPAACKASMSGGGS